MSDTSTKRKSAEPAGEEAGGEGRGRTSRLIILLVAVAAFAFILYSVVTIIGIRSQIRERRQELADIQGQITVQEIKNEEMDKTYRLSDEERSDYIEQIARDDLDYVKDGERVFVNVAGD